MRVDLYRDVRDASKHVSVLPGACLHASVPVGAGGLQLFDYKLAARDYDLSGGGLLALDAAEVGARVVRDGYAAHRALLVLAGDGAGGTERSAGASAAEALSRRADLLRREARSCRTQALERGPGWSGHAARLASAARFEAMAEGLAARDLELPLDPEWLAAG